MVQAITATEAFALIKDDKAILIDVREADEFKGEHIVDALSVPLSSLEDGFKILDLPKDKIFLFQCLRGGRGQTACEHIQRLGLYQNKIINLEGGIQAWNKSGLPVIKS